MLSNQTSSAISSLGKWKKDHEHAAAWTPPAAKERRSIMSVFGRAILALITPPGMLGSMIKLNLAIGLYDADELLAMVPGDNISDPIFSLLLNTFGMSPKAILALSHFGHLWLAVVLALIIYVTVVGGAEERESAAKGTFNLSKEKVSRIGGIFNTPDNATEEDFYFLANCYEQGSGVKRDSKKALSLYSVAAEMKLPKAALTVAKMFESGRGCEIDMDKYYQWLKYAESIGSYEAAKELAKIQSPEVNSGNGAGCFVAGLAFGVIIS